MADEKRKFWENFFEECDSANPSGTKDGKLSIHELKRKLKENGEVTDSKVANIFVDLDKNGDGVITKIEFMTEMMKLSASEAKEEYKKCFQKWDKNGNGKLSRAELKGAINEIGQFKEAEIDCMIEREDKNKDGEIDYNEFMKALCPE